MIDDPFENLEITAEAHAAIRAEARPDRPFKETARKLGNGNYLVPFQLTTITQIKARQLEGETLSDTIIRICKTAFRPLQ